MSIFRSARSAGFLMRLGTGTRQGSQLVARGPVFWTVARLPVSPQPLRRPVHGAWDSGSVQLCHLAPAQTDKGSITASNLQSKMPPRRQEGERLRGR